ncbi:ABC transporter ATP-binding protein [Shewanella chilikensis]|uniref:ATP-binding cassette domain-containing protein n=1 Tax=Shewanella chilikensis TaxID=558541 RepID=A0A6G7LXK8_9GAMM|nr:ABC transporter ATP-binding protein [Shewanella chilikensis]MCL1161144.1 ABC transporter ATP-binding protein [Shewanella chilikensis]QIJ06508.1 ATP-binding cassette domain-containing protein [Shewanella chilikensis]
MEQPAGSLLCFTKVDKSFDGKSVLTAVDLQLEPGMVVGLLGANGAGKSTLMRIALGIIPCDSGLVTTLGQAPQQLDSGRKQCLGYVPQQPFGYEGFSVERALAMHSSFYPQWDMELQQQWLQRFGLDLKAQVQRLSGGQRQSLALIMAMAYRPQLLVLDEPVASLDPVARRRFMADLFELALESGSAVLFSSHITSDLERVASHLALLKAGELLLFKEIDALREEVRLLKFAADSDIQLPESMRLLATTRAGCVVDGYRGQALPGMIDARRLNLEQLFMELHP